MSPLQRGSKMQNNASTALIALACIACRRGATAEAATLFNLAVWDPGIDDFLSQALTNSPEAYMIADSLVSASQKSDLDVAIESLNSALRRTASKSKLSRVAMSADKDSDEDGTSFTVLRDKGYDEDDDEDDEDEDTEDEDATEESTSSSPIQFRF